MLIYEDGARQLQVRLNGETVWLTQAQLADLYATSKQNISLHIQNILQEEELNADATVKFYLTVQIEGSRQVSRSIEHYSLDMILAIGYRVRSLQGTRFRQWATTRLSELLIKGFTLDDERIKAGRTIGQDYFDELLARIRDIRSSERLFYQKITDIYSTSIDYDGNSDLARTFFQTVQNKLHFAAHGQTAAEVVRSRADASRTNMGLTNWKNAPAGVLRKADVTTAKNYLSREELDNLNRLVTTYLDFADLQARRRNPMTMADWIARLDDFLRFTDHGVLANAGSVSHKTAEHHAEKEFAEYDQHRIEAEKHVLSDFDRFTGSVAKLAAEPAPKALAKRPRKRS
jgi:hypothetical protein